MIEQIQKELTDLKTQKLAEFNQKYQLRLIKAGIESPNYRKDISKNKLKK